MSSSTAALSRGITVKQPFYLIMAFVLGAIAILGFSRTVPGDLQTPGFPAVLWVHAAVFTAWVVLFAIQPALAMSGSLRLHRKLGWVGAILAIAMTTLGGFAILLGLYADTMPPFYPHGLFLVRGAMALLLFAGFVSTAVLSRKRSGWHERFMLLATIIVISPGLERAMPVSSFGTNWYFIVDATIDLIACTGPAMDLLSAKRIHPAYFYGISALVLGQLLTDLIAPSQLATIMLHALGTN